MIKLAPTSDVPCPAMYLVDEDAMNPSMEA